MVYLDARLVCLHNLKLKELRVRLVSRAGKLLSVNYKIDTLDDNLVILLVLILSS